MRAAAVECDALFAGGGDSNGRRRQLARDLAELLRGNRDGARGLDIGGDLVAADELGADLADLALGAELGSLDAQDLPGIAEAQGPGRVLEPGGGDARDLHADYEQLDVERRAQAAPLRVEKIARERLHMANATPLVTQYVNGPLPAPLPSTSAAEEEMSPASQPAPASAPGGQR